MRQCREDNASEWIIWQRNSRAPTPTFPDPREACQAAGTSVPYIGYLETGKRHPSEKLVTRLEVLGLDARELFFLANPETRGPHSPTQESNKLSAWEAFCSDETVRSTHNIGDHEMQVLSGVSLLGEEEVRATLFSSLTQSATRSALTDMHRVFITSGLRHAV